MPSTSIWTQNPDLDGFLIELWGDGFSSKRISDRLTSLAGQEISKNSVLSRARRLGLAGRADPLKKSPAERAMIARMVGFKLRARARA